MLFLSLVALLAAPAPPAAKVEVVSREAERRVDVSIDGKPFTAYIWPESQMKPSLWPIRTAKGTEITRGYPIAPKPGERTDHRHHVGLWFSYGDVNGVDFWNNSTARKPEEQARMGRTVQRRIVEAKGGAEGRLTVAADWLLPGDKLALAEESAFVFRALPSGRWIERTTTLRAKDGAVSLKDNKEGVFGLRVARTLEHPSPATEKGSVVGPDLRDGPSGPLDNAGITGSYRSSEGKVGDAVWGTRGRWVALSGRAGEEDVVLVIFDHPKNPGAPTYWHARGYGLFAANPLGQKELSAGKDTLDYAIPQGGSAVFRHALAVLGGPFDEARVEELYRGFAAKP